MAFTSVAKVSEVPTGKGKPVTVGGKTLALFNVEGTFYAIDGECPHRNAPLAEGEVQGKELECPWHGARFNLETGAVLCPPAKHDVKSYKVQVTGEEVQIDV
jgi:nitrite reductase (NADH) small subunit/3-phenylpropionate/trans-cinnamate dioxygenase ferredoxin subunit